MDNSYWKKKYSDVHIRLTNRISELEKENEELKKSLLVLAQGICIRQDKLEENNQKIKRSECPYGGIDCAWCTEDCE